LHVGHIAGAYLPADTCVRYLRACGRDVRFICGSDDNGVAIEISALQEGSTPDKIAARFHDQQARDFAGLGIEFDVYGGTHHPDFVGLHERFSQDFFRHIHDQGYFVKRRTRQLYDEQAQRFLPDRFVRGVCHHCGYERATGDQCDQCTQMIEPLLLKNPVSVITGQAAVVRETTHWYLRLGAFEEPLRKWLESKQGQWRPSVLNFALGQIRQGLPERSMTRDISWGVAVPLDDPEARGKVLYVWFDAPIGYISFTAAWCQQHEGGWQAYERWWADPQTAIIHFIGEDNTVFHALTWPAMLMADGRFQLPHAVVANNFMNLKIGGELQKISKSTTAPDAPVWVEEYLKKGLDPDALRYYLTAQAPESARTAFDPEDFVTRNNSELVAAFGNFVNRALTFADRYFERKVPDAAASTEADRAHIARAEETLRKVGAALDEQRFRGGLEELMAFARICNEYFSVRAPWASRKENLPDCAATIATCVHAVHFLAVMAWPFMPGAARRLLRMLGQPDAPPRWTPPPAPTAGAPLGEPAILFAKLEPGALG
ncbi:MAG: methionine--tRNA ligase, partial [Planctomycetota bacterium]